MLKYKIPQIVTLTLLNPPGLSGEPLYWIPAILDTLHKAG